MVAIVQTLHLGNQLSPDGVGLGSNDVLKFKLYLFTKMEMLLHQTFQVVQSLLINTYFPQGEAGLFNVGGNVVFALNAGTGNQNFGGNDTSDIYFDVEDDMTVGL